MNLFYNVQLCLLLPNNPVRSQGLENIPKKWTYENIFIGPCLVHLTMPTTGDFSNQNKTLQFSKCEDV